MRRASRILAPSQKFGPYLNIDKIQRREEQINSAAPKFKATDTSAPHSKLDLRAGDFSSKLGRFTGRAQTCPDGFSRLHRQGKKVRVLPEKVAKVITKF